MIKAFQKKNQLILPCLNVLNLQIFHMNKLNFSCWSKWDNRISQLDNLQYPGIYVLRISKKNLEGHPFDWASDIKYFGMTISIHGLNGRLNQFNNSLRDKKGGGHGGAERFRNDYQDGEKLAKILYVAVCPFKRHGKDTTVENLLVHGRVAMAEYTAFAEYFKRFDELPKYNKRSSKKLSRT